MGIDNTTEHMKDPAHQLGFLLDSGARGLGDAIERQERAGRSQLVTSDRLPTKCGDHAKWLALGFTFGDPDPSDPLFMPATLPPGWQRKVTEHSMGSVIVDELGRERVSIFYKAAFYDRSAHMSLISLSWYVEKSVEYDAGPIVFDDKWATPETVAAAMREIRDGKLGEAAEFREYAANTASRDADNRASCAEIAERHEAEAAKYDEALTQLEPQS